MTDLPDPMTPADCDLRGYDFMPLYGNRLFGSRFYAKSLRNPRAGLAAMKLWWAAWQQCPAGSLPDDDDDLAMLADFGTDMKGWRAVRDLALHGFVKCADGRLYHPVLCEEAVLAYERRVKERERKTEMRARKRAKQTGRDADVPSGNGGNNTGQTEDVPSVSRGTDRGQDAGRDADVRSDRTGQDRTVISSLRSDTPCKPPAAETPGPARDFEEFWSAYPRKVGKDGARKAFDKARKRAGQAEIMLGLSRHVAVWPGANDERAQFIPHPATWLNRGDWQGDAGSSAAAGRPSTGAHRAEFDKCWAGVPNLEDLP